MLYPLRGALLTAFVAWTRIVYRRLARWVVDDVADYQRPGIAVAGIVGIGASPSCGITTTLDLRASLEVVASCPAARSLSRRHERAGRSRVPPLVSDPVRSTGLMTSMAAIPPIRCCWITV